jgi:hypothetical protein
VVTQQYYSNSLAAAIPQYWSPFQVKQDSVGVLFRVNLASLMTQGLFDPAVQGPVVVRGDSVSSAGVLNWNSNNVILAREAFGVANASFWSGVAYFPKTRLVEGAAIKFKYFVANSTFGGWESNIVDRSLKFTKSDTTLPWQFFNNRAIPTTVENSDFAAPSESMLFPNYPNPFNPSTMLTYSLATKGQVTLSIYNLLGQKIRSLMDEVKGAGVYSLSWSGTDDDGKQVGSGVYFVRMTTENIVRTQKIIFMK